jgi:beta-carotene 15,15'-dioxygenase
MTLSPPTSRAVITATLAAAAIALLWLDRLQPQAGLVVLVVLVGSLGTLHGALDVLLMARHLKTPAARLVAGMSYLLATIAAAIALRSQPGVALLLLLGLSLWHFGEAFDGAPRSSRMQQIAARLVRGGAPVMMPALIARPALEPLVGAAVPGDAAALVWAAWSVLAITWVCITCGWLAWSRASASPERAGRRHVMFELAGLAMLYLWVSPLMAFALFFGPYHAAGHIRRVIGSVPAGGRGRLHRDPRLITALVLTAVMGVLLVAMMRAEATVFLLPDFALRSVILALTAVSIPHVLLISWWAARLSAERAAVPASAAE